MVEGRIERWEVPDIAPNAFGEFPLPTKETEELRSFPDSFQEYLGIEEGTIDAEHVYPERVNDKLITFAYHKRGDAEVHSILIEKPGRLAFEPVLIPSKVISIVRFADGSIRGKVHFFKDMQNQPFESIPHRPESRDVDTLLEFQNTVFLANASVE